MSDTTEYDGGRITIVDDRDENQKMTHDTLVIGSDSFLSGWRQARGRGSCAAWAIDVSAVSLDRVRSHIANRIGITYVIVRHCFGDATPEKLGLANSCASYDLHIYVIDSSHPYSK